MEVRHGRVGLEGGQRLRAAGGAEAVHRHPALGQDADVLRRAGENGGVLGEAEIAEGFVVGGHAAAWRELG